MGSLLLYLKGVDRMEKILRLNEQDIIQALADHFNVDRAKVNLTVKIRTEGYGPTEHQFPEVSAVIVVLSAYTGILMCDMSEVHRYIEKLLGRPVWTHELASEALWSEIKEKAKPDFHKIIEP